MKKILKELLFFENDIILKNYIMLFSSFFSGIININKNIIFNKKFRKNI
jgi:hypothetical protein